ncbi:MAG: glycine cleavage system aminomethyltransferase GcvT, partial [Desulfobacula sp.]|nr:glycine cleavage system aminomethyltransferase GcvT [Desulfobacula sp.]
MTELLRTVLYDKHQELHAKIVEFGGWEMPIQYPEGIINEHMATRTKAGIFDVSHMGRLYFQGRDTLPFLQHVLTNNAMALEIGESQYTLIQNEDGGAIDDAYLYRFKQDEYLLVVNASNREKDTAHFEKHLKSFPDIKMIDKTFEVAMISLQGPFSKKIIEQIVTKGNLPEPYRNSLGIVEINGVEVSLARTGYTGEPLGFELFMDSRHAVSIWNLLLDKKASPIGLGARDTLRLEAGLPLYGHELGMDMDNKEIPIFASKLSKFAVSFSSLKGDFIGRDALNSQHLAFQNIMEQKFKNYSRLPQMVMPLAITGKGIARAGYKIFAQGKHVGFITSGTMIPFQEPEGSGLNGMFKEKPKRRAIALALINSNILEGDILEIEIRKKMCEARVVPYHMSSQAPPFVRSIPQNQLGNWEKQDQVDRSDQLGQSEPENKTGSSKNYPGLADLLVSKALKNQTWRSKECINLIPSEMSQSRISKLLSISDPVNRYAEHKEVKAFCGEDVFYYQGTEFIRKVENLLNKEFQTFFGCCNVESRVISGQMANTAFFSALVDFLNRTDRKNEQRKINKVMNNHIIKGGHLSAQPMGALRDFVARD